MASVAVARALLAPNLLVPRCCLQWITHGVRNLLGQIATQTEPWRARLAVSGDPYAAGALFPAIPAATVGRDGPEAPDPVATPRIMRID